MEGQGRRVWSRWGKCNDGTQGWRSSFTKADVPHLIDIHCVAHRLQLSVLDAIRDHPYISEFESGLKKLFSFYSKSLKQSDDLTRIKLFVALNETKMELYNLIQRPAKHLSGFFDLVQAENG